MEPNENIAPLGEVMTRPKLFRDPVHGQIRFESVDLDGNIPASSQEQIGWLGRKLIDTREFQRLRFVKQNGLANFVFHGAEHSRFSHSMGVAFLAREMFDRIARNSGSNPDDARAVATFAAALLHDVGHGPFSHTIEDVLKDIDVDFHHEIMTLRILTEDTNINDILRTVDASFPSAVSEYIDKSSRTSQHWSHKIVSSQLDADRLDYLMRDAKFAGLQGHGFDLARLLDMLGHLDGTRISVDRRAIEAVEAYLIALDQMYRAVYFYYTVRAGAFLLTSCLKRAFHLWKDGDKAIFPEIGGGEHPLCKLAASGADIDIRSYLSLGEHHVWVLLESWAEWADPILLDLSQRILRRDFFKTIIIDPMNVRKLQSSIDKANELCLSEFNFLGEKDVQYYVGVDEPSRTSYKRYDWRSEGEDESIWMTGGTRGPQAIENEQDSKFVQALRDTRYFHRLVFPREIRSTLIEFVGRS